MENSTEIEAENLRTMTKLGQVLCIWGGLAVEKANCKSSVMRVVRERYLYLASTITKISIHTVDIVLTIGVAQPASPGVPFFT